MVDRDQTKEASLIHSDTKFPSRCDERNVGSVCSTAAKYTFCFLLQDSSHITQVCKAAEDATKSQA